MPSFFGKFMKINNMSYVSLLATLLIVAVAITGCSESPQDKYKDAIDNLKQAKQTRQDAQQTLQQKQQALANAKNDVKQAKSDLQSAKQKVAQAKQGINKTANDKVLFRTIQRKLVDDQNFSNSAISVSVNHRVATLTGTVPDQSTRKKALQTARTQPGIKHVVDSLKVIDQNNKQNNNKGNGGNHAKGDNGGGKTS
jgi:osmotically-inducible protein OsmY